MIEDAELLRRYAREKSEVAFAELVRRRIGLVYSVALRHTHDAHRAEDVTQVVFTDLARKAGQLVDRPVLVGWLFRSAQFAASDAVRAEVRRQAREQEANTMERIAQEAPEPDWAKLRPVLDEVLNQMDERDRDAILLRFFDGESFGEVGAKLRLSENAARMRVERALDKLRALLARRGVTSTTAALAVVLANQPLAAVPAGLAATVTGAALAGGGAVAAGGALATFMSMTKLQMIAAGTLTIAAGTGLALQARGNGQLREEAAALRRENVEIATLRASNLELARTAATTADYRADDAALAQLRDESVALKARLQKVAQAEQARAAAVAAADRLATFDRMPRLIASNPPEYPEVLRRAGVTGEVLVEFIVDFQGKVRNAYAVKSALATEKMEVNERSELVTMVPMTVSGTVAAGPAKSELSAADAQKLLEAAAVEAANQWMFDSGIKRGRAVNTRMQRPVVFSLANDGSAAPK